MKQKLYMLFVMIVMMAMSPVKMWATPTAKAVYNSSTTTLTFYYDEVDHSSEGTVYSLSASSTPAWNSQKANITEVCFDSSFADARPTSCYSWFYNFTNLTTITGIANLNTTNVTDMSYMFFGCKNLHRSTCRASTLPT